MTNRKLWPETFILNNQNNQNINQFSSSDPSHKPSEEDEDQPKGKKCLSFWWIEMVWRVITELRGTNASSTWNQSKQFREFSEKFRTHSEQKFIWGFETLKKVINLN